MVNGMLVASGTHGVVRILVGGYLLLQVPSRFDPCPLRHIRGLPFGVAFVFVCRKHSNSGVVLSIISYR